MEQAVAAGERAEQERAFRLVAVGAMGLITIVLFGIAVLQPALAVRALVTMALVDLLGAGTLLLARRGRTRLASMVLIGGLLALVTANALPSGGIRSPGISTAIVFVMMAGLLLGQRASIICAIVVWLAALSLVVIELVGLLPRADVPYSAWTLLLLLGLYLALAVLLLHLATGSIRRALLNAEAELAERTRAEHDRRQIEEQLRQAQKMEALGTMAGGIAHDFNNILTAIGGNVELAMASGASREEITQSLQEIERAHARARDLVQRILLFSRRQEPDRRSMQLGPVVREALALLRTSLPANIAMQVRIATDLPCVAADATQIHQIVMNLGTNAMHAMSASGGTLDVELDACVIPDGAAAPGTGLAAGRYVRFVVSDTGTGMSPEILARMFEPFFTTKGAEGTGLGMPVVHGIVRDHGGAITVDSELGVGSRFTIHFPAVPNPAVDAVRQLIETPRGSGQHIIYVDDEESIVFVMTRLVERLGYRCTGFTDPAAALHAVRTDPQSVDAVVTDLEMPGINGVQFARALAEIRDSLRVAVASGRDVDDRLALPPNVVARLVKPATAHELGVTIDRLVRAA